MSSGRTTAPFGPTVGSDLKSVLAVPAWFKVDDLELLNDSFEPAFFDGAKREADDEDNEFGGMMSVEEQEEAMLQMAMKASLGDGGAEDPTAAASADQTAPSGRPVAFPLGDGTKQAKNIGRRNNQDTESEVGAGFELVYRRKPEAGDDDMLVTHVIVRGPWECSCPLKHAAVWMLGWERGVLAASTEGVSAAAGSVPADRSSVPAGLDPEDETDLIMNQLYARSKPLRLTTATEYEDCWNSLSEGAREAVLAGIGAEPAAGASSTDKEGGSSGGLCGSRWFAEPAPKEGGPSDAPGGESGSGAGSAAEPVGPASGAGIMGGMGAVGASDGEDDHPQDTPAAKEQAAAAMPRPWALCDHGVPPERVCHTLHPSQLGKLGPAFRPHAVVETAAPLFDGSAALPLAPQVQAASLRDDWGTRPMGPAALHLMLASRHRTADVPTFLNIDVATVHFVGLRGEKARQAAQRLREHAATGGSPMEWAAPRAVPRAPSLPSVVRLMPRPGCLQPVQYDFLNFVSHCPTVHLAAPRFVEGTLAWRRWCSALQAAAQVLSKELPPLQLAHDIVVAQRMLAEIRGGTMDHLTTAKGRVLRGALDEDEGEEGMEGAILDAMPEGAIAGASVSAASGESEAKPSPGKVELLGAEGWFPPGVQAGASASAGLGAQEADRAADLKARLAIAEWARYQQPVLRERYMRAGPLFFTTSRTPWQSTGPTAEDGGASSPAAAVQSSGGPATGAGAGGDDSADIDWEAQFVEPWGAPLEPAGSYLERLSNLFDYDLSDSGLGGDDGGVQIEQPDGSVVTLDGTQSVEGDWAVGHMHIWVLVPSIVRLNGMVSLRPARYRFRDWELARGDKAQDGRGAEAPKVDDVVAFVRAAMAGEAPRFHSGEKSGMPRPEVEEEEGGDAAGGRDPSIAGSGLVELRLPCEEPQLRSVHWHSDELENQQGEGGGEGEPVVVLDKHAPGSHWKRMLLAAESMQLLRLVRPMAAPIAAGHDLGDCLRHAVLVATLAGSKGDDKLVRSLNLLQAWVNGRMRPGRAALQVVVMMVDRNDVDERAMPHVDSPDIRLFLPRGGAVLLAGEATAPLDPEAAQAAGYDAEHAYDCARPLGGALGRHGWSASPAGWVSAGFLEWWLRSGWRDESEKAVGEAPPHMLARAAARTSTSLGAALPRLVRFVRQSTEAARQAAEGAGSSCSAALAELGAAAASVSNLMVALDADEAEVAAGFIEARDEGEGKGPTAPLFPGQELGMPKEALEVAAMEGGGESTAAGAAGDDSCEGAAGDGAEADSGATYQRGSYGSDSFLRLAALAAADLQTQYNSLHGALQGLLQQLERREDGSGQSVDAYHQMLSGTGLPPTPEAAAMAGVPFLEVSAEDEVEEEEDEEGEEEGQLGGDGEEAPEGVVLAGPSEGEGEAGAGKAGPGAAAGGAGDGVGTSGGGMTAGDSSSSGEVGRVVSALAAACTCGSPVLLGRPGGSMALGLELKRLRQRVEAAGLRWPRSQGGSGSSVEGGGGGQSAGDVQWLEDEDHLSAVLQAVGMEEMEAMQRRAMAGLKADGVPGAAVVIAVLDPGSKASMDAGAGAGGSGDALLSQALALVDGATTEGEGGEQAGGVHLYAVDPAEAPGVLTTSGVELSEVPCVMIWGARSQNMKTSQQASHLGVMLAIMRLMGPEE